VQTSAKIKVIQYRDLSYMLNPVGEELFTRESSDGNPLEISAKLKILH